MTTAVFIGGRDFDPKAVAGYLGSLPQGTLVVTGDGEGLEKFVREQAPELGFKVHVPELRPDLYDYTAPGLVTALKKDRQKVYAAGGLFWTVGEKGKVMGTRKFNRALALQVNDLFMRALGGTLVLVGKGGRVGAAREILKRLTQTKTYDQKDVYTTRVPVEVVEL